MIIGPRPTEPPNADTLRSVRFRPNELTRQVELWTLLNIGPGSSGDFDLREPTDRWHLGQRLGFPTLWFYDPVDWERFIIGAPFPYFTWRPQKIPGDPEPVGDSPAP
jgi:hypothetical protein